MLAVLVLFVLILVSCVGYYAMRVFIDMQPGRGSARELKEYQNSFADLQLKGRVREGRLFYAKDPKGLVIISHNWGASQNRYYPLADELASHGYHVFLYDLRGQGKNAGRNIFWMIGVAPKIKADLQCLLAELRGVEELKGLPFFLLGFSLGAGVSLEVFKHDRNLQGLICDSGPFTLKPSVCDLLIKRTIPDRSGFAKWMINHLFCLIVNFPKTYHVIDNLAACQGRRVMLIECGRETFIPNDEIEALKILWPGDVTFWRVPRAQHLMAYAVESKEYMKRVVKFLG